MHNSKILRLLGNLDEKEFRLLSKFLRSPFFNYSSAITDLYDYLRKYHPEFEHAALDRKKIYRKLFKGQGYDDKKMRNLLHEFGSRVEDFLIQLQLRKDEHGRKKLLMEAYADRNLYEAFEQKYESLLKSVQARPYRDLNTYLEILNLSRTYYFHPLTDKLKKGDGVLNTISDNLDHFYKAAKLLMVNEQMGIRGLVKKPEADTHPIHFLEDLYLGAEEEPIVRLYYLIYQLNRTQEEACFREARQLFLGFFEQLGFDDQQLIIHQLINYAARLANLGHTDYYRIGFELFRQAIEHELLFSNGRITENAFTNIVVFGIKAGEMGWVEWFIPKYQHYLDEEHRENASLLGLSFLYYSQKRWTAVDELIGNHQFSSVFYQLRTRSILLRALYELFLQDDSYYELITARIEAFEKYLRRHPVLSEVKKDSYLYFMRMLRKLIKWKMEKPNAVSVRNKLRKEIREAESLLHREWFLDQISMGEPGT
jgi:hypothetical protein